MIPTIVTLLSIPFITVLVLFTIRRIIFTFTILATHKESKRILVEKENLLDVLILIACRDEARMIPRLAESLRQLEYPQHKLQVVMIDDGSADQTATVMQEQTEQTAG